MHVADLPAERVYDGAARNCRWEGYEATDAEAFAAFMAGPVADRLADDASQRRMDEELALLRGTGMATEALAAFFRQRTERRSWAIGEALAEALLACDEGREVVWPWNPRRDARSPRASLPGADLVGLCATDGGFRFLFGEVKTSSQQASPPGVMTGQDGLPAQLRRHAEDRETRRTLIFWLLARCTSPAHRVAFRQALTSFASPDGPGYMLVGVLLRDTQADQRDVAGPGRRLGERVASSASIDLFAWYLPVSVDRWPQLQGGAA